IYALKHPSPYALKCHINAADASVSQCAIRELSCLKALQGHPNIIEIEKCFMYENEIATLMPYCPLTLHRVLFRYPRVPLPLAFVSRFSCEVANALAYMHARNIIHRDLVPSNVLLTDTAPELFYDGDTMNYTCAIDMWSLGVMIVDATENTMVFLRGKRPSSESTYTIIMRTFQTKNDVQPCYNKTMPNVMACEHTTRIVFKLLRLQPSERWTARELLADNEWKSLPCDELDGLMYFISAINCHNKTPLYTIVPCFVIFRIGILLERYTFMLVYFIVCLMLVYFIVRLTIRIGVDVHVKGSFVVRLK
uniref:Protein kinase domain-containing protein n=1 Tax=Nothobranchius furzeri TaxID=105023 RepID=A0A8C6P5E1_NOTFU